MNASEKARRLLTIITSMGLLQWCVLPFGVTHGPSYCQEAMTDIFGDMTGDRMSDLNALLEFFIDDGGLGTRDCDDPWAQDEEDDTLFAEHPMGLTRLLTRASEANLRFKLCKCWLAQYSVSFAGVGVVKPGPKKTLAI